MSVLFVALLFVFIYIPMDIAEPISLYAFSFSALMVVMLFVVKAERESIALGAFLGISSALSSWAITIVAAPSPWMEASAFGFTALFIGYVIYTIVMRIIHERAVSIHTVAAALSAYLLLGILWAMFYTAFAAISPGAYTSTTDLILQNSAGVDLFPSLLYFSFTTLTTLGFGDIYPATMAAFAYGDRSHHRPDLSGGVGGIVGQCASSAASRAGA
ncbi:MAG: hypothetical protein IPK16_18195 [Anaerolineales bacterium]|nr:hypothetical protein [Anaerolineales bacterium]